MRVDALYECEDTCTLVVFEYDGSWWHEADENVERDTMKTQKLLDNGILVIRLREGDLKHLRIHHPGFLQLSSPPPSGDITNIQPFLDSDENRLTSTRLVLVA